ncbi:hypothetical protein D8674_017743 [Pyrus ussuriensis x Pyrus communis]|uniref:Uncharacterized protein n=1 Tax=Pyrus ussuriensis x Pyrus communis TaxID=2448454 RepID=A0A5N5HHK3_9ROSA|nr:hypothetical protein D8674_017743 [Pyrus ussuriensis x Pyrus communis]
MDYPPDSFNPNKRLKEEFVSNLSGSSMMEIAALTTIILILLLLRHNIGSHRVVDVASKKNDDAVVGSKGWAAYMASLSLGFLLIILPIVLVYTVLAEWMYIWATLLMLLLHFSIPPIMRSHSCHVHNARRCLFGSYSTLKEDPYSIRQNMLSYRVATMIITCFCILAVDFRIFPRRYAKTETYGTGWVRILQAIWNETAIFLSLLSWKTAIQSASPLIILGFVHLLSTTGVDYQVHVAEYGVHWNFFFTLSGVSILTSIINVPAQYSGILGSLILVGYQVCLMHGLNSYLLSNERGADIISQNKEGFFSIFGKCLSLNIFHSYIITITKHIPRVNQTFLYNPITLGYVLAILLVSDFLPGSKTSAIEEAYDRNLLGTFLCQPLNDCLVQSTFLMLKTISYCFFVPANLLTGLVNLMVDALFASAVKARFILIAYTFSLTFIVGFLDFWGIRLKFW